jgi:hypothetical protein
MSSFWTAMTAWYIADTVTIDLEGVSQGTSRRRSKRLVVSAKSISNACASICSGDPSAPATSSHSVSSVREKPTASRELADARSGLGIEECVYKCPLGHVWSEITHNLDSRSLSGQHIFDHIQWEVEQHVFLRRDGSLYRNRWSELVRVSGLYVHPTTRLLCYARESRRGYRAGPFLKAQAALRTFGIDVSKAAEIRRYRVDVTRVWERRDDGWFIHTYRYVPEQLVRVITRSDGHDVPIYSTPRYERAATKQASKKEIRDARRLLERDRLCGASR